MKKILEYMLYFFCFCPFIFPLPGFGTDVQPYAFLIAIVCILRRQKLYGNRLIALLGGYVIFAIVLGLFAETDMFSILKCIYSYLSLFIVTWAVYNELCVNDGFDERFAKKVMLLWFVVGLIQMFLMRNFGQSFVSGARTTLDRGVFGLASEPSFFGVQCFYFMFVVSLFKKNRNWYYLLVLFMAIVLAQSFTGITFMMTFMLPFVVNLLLKRKVKLIYIVFFICGTVAGIIGLQEYFLERRVGFLLQTLSQGGVAALLDDQSTFNRYTSIKDALDNSWENYFFPLGFSERIGSMFGSIVSEFGFFGIPLIFVIVRTLASFFHGTMAVVIAFVLFVGVFFSNVQLSNPMIAFVLALGLYKTSVYVRQ